MKHFSRTIVGLLVLVWSGAPALADDHITIAVSYFQNTSQKAELEPLKKGIAEMLITDLSISKEIKLVERSRLNDVLKELDLQKTKFIDQKTAAKLGKGLGAAYIVVGSYLVQNDLIRVDARLVDVETSDIVLAVKQEGKTSEFFNIQRGLASQLLKGVGASLNLLQKKKLGKGSTKNYTAFTQYSSGLDHMDRGDQSGAKKALEEAIKADPDFKAAQALKAQIDKMAKAFDLATYQSQMNTLARFIAGDQCDSSYTKSLSELKKASGGTRIAYRLIKLFGETPVSGATAWISMLRKALMFAQVGLFERSEQLLKAISSPDYVNQETGFCPNEQEYWQEQSEYSFNSTCAAHQALSYVYLMQLKLKEAMVWQLKAVNLPKFGRTLQCISGSQMGLFGITVKAPIKELIQKTMDDPVEFKKRKLRKEMLEKLGVKVAKKLKQMKKKYSCADINLCKATPPKQKN